MQDDELLTLQDVARQLSVNEKTIRRWIQSGELPAIEIARKYRIRRSDLQIFLDKHYKQPQDKEP